MTSDVQELPAAAHNAWQAYLDMMASKQEHYSLLEAMEDDRLAGKPRSLVDSVRLDTLQNAHTETVTRFSTEMQALRATDEIAHTTLLRYFTRINQDKDTPVRDN